MNMFKFRFDNVNMSVESYGILERAAKRIFEERRCQLSDVDGYAISVRVDRSFKDDRYTINSNETNANIEAANDCAIHAAVFRFLLESDFNGLGDFTPYVGYIDFVPKSPYSWHVFCYSF